MPFSFDITNPTDDFLVPSYPANERNHRAAVSGMLAIEHDNAEGRHSFAVGTTAARDAITTWVDGSIYGNESIRSGYIVLQIRDGGAWVNIDISPVDGGSAATLPRLDGASKFTSAQWALWEVMTITPGTPDSVTPVLADSPHKYFTAVNDTQIENPTVPSGLGGYSTIFFIDLAMDGTGGYDITWGSQYRAPSSLAIATGANERTLLQCFGNRNGNYIVSTIADFNIGL